MTPSVSILLCNYKTPRQTRLCLRSLRRYTRLDAQCVVVDNGSADESLAYLRALPWIELVENPLRPATHNNGLQEGLARTTGEWICILHSDTYVRAEGWLQTLLGHADLDRDRLLATEDRLLLPLSPWTRWNLARKRRRRRKRRAQRRLLSHCAVFHRSLFEAHGQRFDHASFEDGRYVDCAVPIQRYCEERGLPVRWLEFEELAPLMWHFEAATLNLVTGRRLAWKRRLRAWLFYRRPEVRALLADASLDR